MPSNILKEMTVKYSVDLSDLQTGSQQAKSLISDVSGAARDASSAFGDLGSQSADALSMVMSALTSLTEMAAQVGPTLSDGADMALAGYGDLASGAQDALAQASDSTASAADALDEMATQGGVDGDSLVSVLSEIADAIASLRDAIVDLSNQFADATDSIVSSVNDVRYVIESMSDMAESNLEDISAQFGDLALSAESSSEAISESSSSAEGAMGGMGGSLMNLFFEFQMVKGIVQGLFDALLKPAMDAQAEMTQTEQVLKSTHDASGETAQSIADLAAELGHLTEFGDDATQSAENMLLTFTNIGKDIFPEATRTVLDMSQALGQDAKDSAIQLGKALNDPIAGIEALRRVGVTFTDSQKKLIQSLVDSGNVEGAQKVILQELQKEFGGSAEAAGQTFPGQLDILKQSLEDMSKKIGGDLLPIFSDFVGFLTATAIPDLEAFGGHIGAIGKDISGFIGQFDFTPIASAFGDLKTAIDGIFAPLENLGSNKAVSGFFADLKQDLSGGITTGIKDLAGFLSGLAKDLSGLAQDKSVTGFLDALGQGFQKVKLIVGGQLGQDFQLVGKTVQQLGQWFQSSMLPAIKQAEPGFSKLGTVLATDVAPALATVWADGQKLYRETMPPLIKAFETVAPIVVKVGGFLADNLGKALEFFTPYVVDATGAITDFAGGIVTRVTPIVSELWSDLQVGMGWLEAIWKAVWPSLSTSLTDTWDVIQTVIKVAWHVVSGIIDVGLDLLSGNWSGAWDDVKGIFKNVWDDVKGLASDAWNGIKGIIIGGIDDVIRAINGFINGIDSIHINIPGVGNVGFSIPDIPLLASGGVVGPGKFIAGDEGPELIDTVGGAKVYSRSQTAEMFSLGGGGYERAAPAAGPTEIHVHVHMDSQEIAHYTADQTGRIIVKKLAAHGPALGRAA